MVSLFVRDEVNEEEAEMMLRRAVRCGATAMVLAGCMLPVGVRRMVVFCLQGCWTLFRLMHVPRCGVGFLMKALLAVVRQFMSWSMGTI